MSRDEYYRTLKISPKSGRHEVKRAYRKLAMKYHPDRNSKDISAKKFQEITEAYDILMKEEPQAAQPYTRESSYKEATNRHREEQKKARAQAEKRRQKKEEAQADFKKNRFHDIVLFFQYFVRILALLFSIAAIITPFVLAILIEPIVLAATFFLVIIGSFLLWHIIHKRKTWFNLGRFYSRHYQS